LLVALKIDKYMINAAKQTRKIAPATDEQNARKRVQVIFRRL